MPDIFRQRNLSSHGVKRYHCSMTPKKPWFIPATLHPSETLWTQVLGSLTMEDAVSFPREVLELLRATRYHQVLMSWGSEPTQVLDFWRTYQQRNRFHSHVLTIFFWGGLLTYGEGSRIQSRFAIFGLREFWAMKSTQLCLRLGNQMTSSTAHYKGGMFCDFMRTHLWLALVARWVSQNTCIISRSAAIQL